MRKDLFEFLRFGVVWHGAIAARPRSTELLDAAQVLDQRFVRAVLERIAQALHSSRPGAGVRLPLTVLAGGLYGRRRVAEALALAGRAGIVQRERKRLARGQLHEDLARTFVNPLLLAVAKTWAVEWKELRVKDSKAPAPKCVVEIPLIDTSTTGEQELARLPEGQCAISARCCMQKLHGVFHTHPAPPAPPGAAGC